MKYLCRANTDAQGGEINLLKDILEREGIACMIRNENLSIAQGEIPFSECSPELWVLDDEHYSKAKEIINGWRESLRTQSAWVCPTCKETIEGQFTSCWKCGYEHETA